MKKIRLQNQVNRLTLFTTSLQELWGGGNTGQNLAKFNYSFDSTSDPKTLEFQLTQIWDSNGVAKTYNDQIKEAKKNIATAKSAIITALSNDNLYTAFAALQAQNITSDQIKEIILRNANDYMLEQELLLDTYLKQKYEAVIKMQYTLNENSLNLQEVCTGDLSNASAKFSNTNFVINDYENLLPFSYTKDGKTYVGVPQIYEVDGETKISTVLFPAFLSANDTDISSKVSAKITEITQTLQKTENITAFSTGLSQKKSVEEIIGEIFQTVMTGSSFAATYSFTENNTKLTLSNIITLGVIDINQGESIELNFAPTFNLNLTKN